MRGVRGGGVAGVGGGVSGGGMEDKVHVAHWPTGKHSCA